MSRLQPLLFPAAFVLELFTHDSDFKQKDQQRWAYDKFPSFENLGSVVSNIGTFLRYERDNQLPAGPSLSETDTRPPPYPGLGKDPGAFFGVRNLVQRIKYLLQVWATGSCDLCFQNESGFISFSGGLSIVFLHKQSDSARSL